MSMALMYSTYKVYTFNNIHIYIHTTYVIITLYLDTQQVGLVIEIYPHLIPSLYKPKLNEMIYDSI